MDTPPPEVATVVETLRFASKWMPEGKERSLLLAAAETAETYWDGFTCCPVCEEPGRCDDDCPLRMVRAQLDV